jgi:hypothetical protein
MAETLTLQQRIQAIHQEAKGELAKQKANYCPFGCATEDIDEYGYCHHLMGFTNDRLTYEQTRRLYRHNEDGIPYDTGYRITNEPVECKKGDVFINPERPQIVNNAVHMAKAWVSDRVYRNVPKPEADPIPAAMAPNEDAILKRRLRDLEKAVAQKEMKERIAELEKKLGEEADLDKLEKLTAPAK